MLVETAEAAASGGALCSLAGIMSSSDDGEACSALARVCNSQGVVTSHAIVVQNTGEAATPLQNLHLNYCLSQKLVATKAHVCLQSSANRACRLT